MKKLGMLCVAVLLSFSLAACNQQKNGNPSGDTGAKAQEKNEIKINQSAKIGEDVLVDGGKYSVRINSVEKVEDVNGAPAVHINYSFTNHTEEPTSAMASAVISVFQDQNPLEVAIVLNEDVSEDETMNALNKGETAQNCELDFLLISDKELEIGISSLEEFFKDEYIIIKTDLPK